MKIITSIFAGLIFLITGCAGIKPKDYEAEKPKLDLREYFNGRTQAWGVIEDWRGKIIRRFHVVVDGKLQGNVLTMNEDFTYDDGSKDKRTWTITFADDQHFTGTAHDVVGTAQGEQQGNAMNVRYTLRVPRGSSTIDLSMDDWMYRIDERTIINRTTMRKFGFKVGELSLAFRK